MAPVSAACDMGITAGCIIIITTQSALHEELDEAGYVCMYQTSGPINTVLDFDWLMVI